MTIYVFIIVVIAICSASYFSFFLGYKSGQKVAVSEIEKRIKAIELVNLYQRKALEAMKDFVLRFPDVTNKDIENIRQLVSQIDVKIDDD